MKDQQRFDADLRAFLGRAYNLKAIADYETGPGSFVTPRQARATASRSFWPRNCRPVHSFNF
jgi:hypothetical protein